MTTLFVGDVHGCADELDQLLSIVRPSRVVLVGDLFTKGPDPAGVFSLVRPHRAVLGNHDDRLLLQRKGDTHAREVAAAIGPAGMKWVAGLPLQIDVGRFRVVHAGLHPTEPSRRKHLLFLRKVGARYWWQQYKGKRGVIFGHDARRGLVRVERDGAPHLLGLDTGCVYGGKLTGWILEEDRYVQVQGRPWVKV